MDVWHARYAEAIPWATKLLLMLKVPLGCATSYVNMQSSLQVQVTPTCATMAYNSVQDLVSSADSCQNSICLPAEMTCGTCPAGLHMIVLAIV